MIPISPAIVLGLLIAIHSETALAQTTLVPSSYVAEENYLYCNPAPNGDKRHADFRPDLDHEPDIYPASGFPRSSGFYAVRFPGVELSLQSSQSP
jgi:hypothetical protein